MAGMAQGSANIDSPDVVKRFRSHFVKFAEECQRALDGAHADVNRVREWLAREQAPYWKHELAKCEEQVEHARREYSRARLADTATRKNSCVDEKKALDRAIRRRTEAEEKLQAVKKWLPTIEREAAKALGPCASLKSLLRLLVPQALARLDQMLDSLDEYLRPTAAGPSG